MAEQERLVLTNLAMTRVGGVLVTCLGTVDPTDDEVARMLERFDVADYQGLLFSAKGAGPNSKQRARIAEYWKKRGKPPRSVLLSDSATARFVGQAISWLLNVEVKFFAQSEVAPAVAYLGSIASVAEVTTTIASLHAAIEFKQRRAG